MLNKDPKVVFLMERELSFALTGVRNFLEEGRVKSIKMDITECTSLKPDKMPTIAVAEAEVLLKHAEQRVAFYDICMWHNTGIILVGNPEELDEVMNVTSKTLVLEKFTRPINAKEVTERIEMLLEVERRKANQYKIMVIDDSPTFLRTAKQWFGTDYNVSIYPSASAALRVIESQRPDLILLDYEMPVCTGAQFLEMLHSEISTDDIPVIFLTSKNDANTVKEVLALSPQGYLLKTQPKEEILRAVKEFFEKEI
ncbi:MAG: response regulator [Lachnospiraceae bacterium]|nr:response regulator [Lachnospiraceae bacterium]